MKKHQILSLLLTAVLLFSCCACGAMQSEEPITVNAENLMQSVVKVVSDAEDAEKAIDADLNSSAEFEAGDSITFTFQTPVRINRVILQERGADCEAFSLYGEDEQGERTLLYSNDVIDDCLYCAFPEAEVSKLIFTVDKTDGDSADIQDIAAYCVETERDDFRVHAYYPYWGSSEFFQNPENAEKYKQDLDTVTDMILIGNIYWNEDGTLEYDAGALQKEMAAIREMIGERDVRVWTCILNPRKADGSIDNSASVKSINKHLDTLTDNIVSLCKDYGFDGVDFDWEYPRLPHIWSAYSKLLINLKAKLTPENLLLSSALGPWGNMLSKEAKAALDYVNVMSYDWAKNDRNYHAEFYTCHYFSAKYFLRHGFKREQLVLGVPFYGNTTGKEYGQLHYESFTVTDKGQNTAICDGMEYYFNGYNSIYSKTAFNYDNGFAGTMIWSGASDQPRDSEYSLFNAMHSAISGDTDENTADTAETPAA
ncbi:MAG: glycoside hydrolase family 18 protein [Candidatus Fimenecus sp.]